MSFWDDFRKPVNFVSVCLAVVSLVAAYLFYVKSQKEAVPSFTVTPSQFKIFDSHIASPKIKVYDSHGQVIDENVYLAEVVFWNSGNIPIEPRDVRIPVRLVLTPCKAILDYKIIRETRPIVAAMQLAEDTSANLAPQTKSLILTWNHLDPGFGGRFQVIYSSSEPASISFDGYIVGTKGLLSVAPRGQEPFLLMLFDFLAAGVFVACGLFVIGLIFVLIKKDLRQKVEYKKIIIIFLFAIILLLVRFVFLVPLEPPV